MEAEAFAAWRLAEKRSACQRSFGGSEDAYPSTVHAEFSLMSAMVSGPETLTAIEARTSAVCVASPLGLTRSVTAPKTLTDDCSLVLRASAQRRVGGRRRRKGPFPIAQGRRTGLLRGTPGRDADTRRSPLAACGGPW